MVSKLDESVGQIIEALESKEMLKDSIIVFMSDNGAPSAINGTQPARSYPNFGSNFPFRGVSMFAKIFIVYNFRLVPNIPLFSIAFTVFYD